MDDDTEIELKNICCTCLSIDRKLKQLCKINDGVNNLYFLLSYDPEAYKEGFFKESASLHICWECRALLRRVICFRLQACIAQKYLASPKIKQVKSLSHLKTHHNSTYNDTITWSCSQIADNFIDCDAVEVKTEVDDLEDVPLSELHSFSSAGDKIEYSSDQENHTEDIPLTNQDETEEINIDIDKKNIFTSEKKLKKETNAKKKARIKHYNVVVMNEKEMYESRERRKEDAAFVDAASKCEPCIEAFKSQIELDDHNVMKHTAKPDHSLCDICLSYTPSSCTEHRGSHFLQYACRYCEHAAGSMDEMVTHLSVGHDINNLGVTAKRKKGKHKPPAVLRPGSKPRRNAAMMDKRTPFGYQCTECKQYFENKNQRWKHIQMFHREGFRCHSCGKRFAFKHSLIRHEQLHSAPPPREECPVCNKMIRVDLVKIHARIHTHRETYSCAACDKSFVSRASYQHHLKYTMSHSNTDILKYKCSMCDKGYRSRGELRDHENYQHKGHTQHQCPICGKALATRRCITRHVRRAHHGVKESARDKICQQCGKAFRDKKGLREHEFIHTGERPLSCEVCGRTFRQSASLYTHRKRVHRIHAPRKVCVIKPVADGK